MFGHAIVGLGIFHILKMKCVDLSVNIIINQSTAFLSDCGQVEALTAS